MVSAASRNVGFQIPVCTVSRSGRPSSSKELRTDEGIAPSGNLTDSRSRKENIAARTSPSRSLPPPDMAKL
jgi:hypothetical protein